jgi:hypothetical protein
LGKGEVAAASREVNDEQIKCYLDAADLTSKHTLICAVDGTGKTHTATVIIEELANKTGHPIVILDPNNEYSTIGTIPKLDKNPPFSLQTEIIHADAKISLDTITKKVKQGQVTIITAENLSLTEKSAYYSNVLNVLAQSRREKTTQPFLLVVEDAENLPLQAILEILSANGIATVLITAYPTLLGGRVLSKMGTQIAGRTIDPLDLAFLKNMIDCSDEQLSSLGVGEWVINGLNIMRATKIHVRAQS